MIENCFMQNNKNFKVDDKIGTFRKESLKLLVRNRTQEQDRKKNQWSKIKMISKLIIFLPIKFSRKNNNVKKKIFFHQGLEGGSVRDGQIDRESAHFLTISCL